MILPVPGARVPARTVAVGLPAAAVGTAAAVGLQAWWAGHRRLPVFDELDPSGAFGAEGRRLARIVLLGDSSMTGPGLEHASDIWICQVAARLAERYRIELVNEAMSGSRVQQVLDDQLPLALAAEADIAVISVGANDAIRGTPMKRFERQLDEIVDVLCAHHDTTVLCGVADVGNAPRLPFPIGIVASGRSAMADQVHSRVAARDTRAVKIQLRRLVEDRFRDPSLFSDDLFHPNADGHAVWAAAAFPVFATAVAQAIRSRELAAAAGS